jgi:hypothetical protein
VIDTALQTELLKRVNELTPEMQHRVLEYVTGLAPPPLKGTPGSKLLKFSGCITEEDAQLMLKAIEESCEQVDYDKW